MGKCIVMLSGGLDSRLAVKLMQEKGYDVVAFHFRLPFSKDVVEEVKNFCEGQKVKLKIVDCTKGKLFRNYLDIVRKPKHHRGACLNPCVDCRIFALRNAKRFADEEGIKFIATGEVEGQRPMSQMRKSMKIIEEESGLSGRLLRPVSEIASGRRRDKQVALAKKFEINYPGPGGGCLLCEKMYCEKLKKILGKKDLNYKDIGLLKIGRHFENSQIILGRNKKENGILEKENGIKVIPKQFGGSALVKKMELVEKAKKLIQKYSKHKIEEFGVRE